jgi:protein gp37
MAMRFEGKYSKLLDSNGNTTLDFHTKNTDAGVIYTLDEMKYKRLENGNIMPSPYPFGFTPTFHRYRLSDPQQVKKPQRIFVCSMADLFGDWVPDSQIQQVFAACEAAPWHTYLFLTKNPWRYIQLQNIGVEFPPYSWLGVTVTGDDSEANTRMLLGLPECTFISAEPLLSDPKCQWNWLHRGNWTIIGAESGNRKDKVVPEKSWVQEIVRQCKNTCVPVFMKESLRDLMGEDFVQEWPEGLEAKI